MGNRWIIINDPIMIAIALFPKYKVENPITLARRMIDKGFIIKVKDGNPFLFY